jgi:hypothetical protein
MQQDQNYIEVIKAVWKWYQSSILEPNDYCLMMRLIAISNDDMGWENCFLRNNYELIGTTKLSYKQITNSRNKLQQAGLISFEQRNGNANCKYEIHYSALLNLSKNGKAKGKVKERLGKGDGVDKLNETKLNQTSKSHSPPDGDVEEIIEEKIKTLYWKKFVETWFWFFGEKFKHPENGNPKKPRFKAAQAKQLKDIVEHLQKICTEASGNWSEANAVHYLRGFLEKAWNDEWLQKHFELKNLVSNIDSITNSKKEDGKSNTHQQPSASGRQTNTSNIYAARIAASVAALASGGTPNTGT